MRVRNSVWSGIVMLLRNGLRVVIRSVIIG